MYKGKGSHMSGGFMNIVEEELAERLKCHRSSSLGQVTCES